MFDFDVSSGITTNQAEDFNSLPKSLPAWHEVPFDVIMYAFHMLQREISRGKAGLGNYSLLSKYEDKKIEIEEICKFQVCFPEKITKSLNASNNRFQADRGELLQIMNTDPNGSGVHWFTFSTLRGNLGVVNIYGSASQPGNLRSVEENAIAKLVHTG